jgi:hypothetical protein
MQFVEEMEGKDCAAAAVRVYFYSGIQAFILRLQENWQL